MSAEIGVIAVEAPAVIDRRYRSPSRRLLVLLFQRAFYLIDD
jgi:hypothetical protein